MEAIYEDLHCLKSQIEFVRTHLHLLVIINGNIDEEAVRLSQLLDEYIVQYTKEVKSACEED